MGSIIDTFLPSSIYNTLPFISQVAEAPDDHSKDLQDLRELLRKHNVPKGVSVRLIHKHFDTTKGEVMVFNKITVPGHGVVQIMKPILPLNSNQLRGIHYFVDDNMSLQAYEYGNYEVPDMMGFESFLTEFCRLVSERGLQRKFGLKLQSEGDKDQTGWTEYELHAKRGTIMFPDGMPMPDGGSDYSVTLLQSGKQSLMSFRERASIIRPAGMGGACANTADTATVIQTTVMLTTAMTVSAWVGR